MRIDSNAMLLFFHSKVKISIFVVIAFSFFLFSDASGYNSILLFSIIIHELSHILCMRLFGCNINCIQVYPFGVTIQTSTSHLPYLCEALILVSGCISNFLVCILTLPILKAIYTRHLLFLLFCNAFLGVTNLLPIRAFDGGRVLEKVLCIYISPNKAYYVTKTVSRISVIILICVSLFLLSSRANLSFSLMLLYISFCAIIGEKLT